MLETYQVIRILLANVIIGWTYWPLQGIIANVTHLLRLCNAIEAFYVIKFAEGYFYRTLGPMIDTISFVSTLK